MKRWLILLTFCLSGAWTAAQTLEDAIVTGSYLGPMVEIGEVNGEVNLSLGLIGGIDFRRYSVGFFGLRTQDRYAHQLGDDAYQVQLTYGGLWGQVFHQATEDIRITAGLRTAWGQAALSWDNRPPDADNPREDLWLAVPEFGFELRLNSYASVTISSGLRLCAGAEGMPGLRNRDFNTLINAVSIRLGRRP